MNNKIKLYSNEFLTIFINEHVIKGFDLAPKDVETIKWYCDNKLRDNIRTGQDFADELRETGFFDYETPLYWSDTERYFNWIIDNGELEEIMDEYLVFEDMNVSNYKEFIEAITFGHGQRRMDEDFYEFEECLIVEFEE